VLAFALAVTSNDASQRRLRRWWKRLHQIGLHFIWLVFLLSYASRIPDSARTHIGLVTPIALAALGLRFVARCARQRTLPAPLPSRCSRPRTK
jgi:DMSO/TMAO reductase YedYZ heme-binding membrane subunit